MEGLEWARWEGKGVGGWPEQEAAGSWGGQGGCLGSCGDMEYGPWGPKGLALNPGSVVYFQGDLPDFSADFAANLTSQIPQL